VGECTLVIRGGRALLIPPHSMRWVDESSSGKCALKPAPRAPGTRGGSGPPGGMLVLPRGRSGWTREVPDPYGGSGASAVSFGASLPQGHVASPDLSQAGNRSGAVSLVR